MSDEYQLTIHSPLPDHFFEQSCDQINATTAFNVFDKKSHSLYCIHQHENLNEEVIRWGGHFNLHDTTEKMLLTINSGNVDDIKTIVTNLFRQLNIDFTLNRLEK